MVYVFTINWHRLWHCIYLTVIASPWWQKTRLNIFRKQLGELRWNIIICNQNVYGRSFPKNPRTTNIINLLLVKAARKLSFLFHVECNLPSRQQQYNITFFEGNPYPVTSPVISLNYFYVYFVKLFDLIYCYFIRYAYK